MMTQPGSPHPLTPPPSRRRFQQHRHARLRLKLQPCVQTERGKARVTTPATPRSPLLKLARLPLGRLHHQVQVPVQARAQHLKHHDHRKQRRPRSNRGWSFRAT